MDTAGGARLLGSLFCLGVGIYYIVAGGVVSGRTFGILMVILALAIPSLVSVRNFLKRVNAYLVIGKQFAASESSKLFFSDELGKRAREVADYLRFTGEKVPGPKDPLWEMMGEDFLEALRRKLPPDVVEAMPGAQIRQTPNGFVIGPIDPKPAKDGKEPSTGQYL